jgi:hypothetical protein
LFGKLAHMLRLGRPWGYLAQVPEIDMPKKPEGRRRFHDEAEIGRLLEAARNSVPCSSKYESQRD